MSKKDKPREETLQEKGMRMLAECQSKLKHPVEMLEEINNEKYGEQLNRITDLFRKRRE